MRKIEVKLWFDEEQNKSVNAIYVDNEVFDWSLVEDGLRRARQYVKKNPLMEKAVYGDIQNHFVTSFSEFLGHSITLKEINEAIEKGYIECTS
jgi:hypothetical protein